MAVVSMLNQAQYRRTIASRERINSEESNELHGGNDGSKSSPPLNPGCRSRTGKVLSANHHCALDTCERVVINVSGQYFETWRATLEKHPDTLLGNPAKRHKYFDKKKNEYFFDRHRPTFDAIFDYYIYGAPLKRPPPVPDDIFLSELEFFEIEKDVVDEYRREEGYATERVVLPEKGLKRVIWMTMEYPETSTLAYIIAIASVVVTVLSIALFCVETLPQLADISCAHDMKPNFADPFFILETIYTAFFTFEVLIRVAVCPSKKKFMKDFKNLVDFTAVIPYYVTLFNMLSSTKCGDAKSSTSLAFLRVIRLIRIFKLTKHSAGLQVLILTFKASFGGLCLFLVALGVCILVFSSAVYFAELDTPGSQIQSIPDGFWWAIITMTTVGYGDVCPVGPLGKLVGMTCALAGVLTLAIPVPIITENFNKFYAHKTGRGKL
ncbi:hypothetical protein ACOMHN_047368 [Nucella lapillus]